MIKRLNTKIAEEEEEKRKLEGRKVTKPEETPEMKETLENKPTASQNQIGGSPNKNHLDGPTPQIKCEFNKHGFCKQHRILAKKIEVSKNVWKERSGGRGYGNVRTKVTKFMCPLRNLGPVDHENYPIGNNHKTSSIRTRNTGLVGGEVAESSRSSNIQIRADSD